MARKNNRIRLKQDSNFTKFMDSVNNANKPKPDSNPKRNKHNDVSKLEKQRSNPVKIHQQFKNISDRNRERAKYASERFTQANIKHRVLNAEKGVLGVQNAVGEQYIYYASTGTLKNVDNVKGIKQIIVFLNSSESEKR